MDTRDKTALSQKEYIYSYDIHWLIHQQHSLMEWSKPRTQ